MPHAKYLGETPVTNYVGTPFEGFTAKDWALEYIANYGQIDGGHHKQWVLDQVARILLGTKVEVVLAKWEDGQEEYRFTTKEPATAKYKKWVIAQKGEKIYDEEYDEYEYEYGYDKGIAP